MWKPWHSHHLRETLAVQSEELGDGDLTNTGDESGRDEKDEDDLEEVMLGQKLHVRGSFGNMSWHKSTEEKMLKVNSHLGRGMPIHQGREEMIMPILWITVWWEERNGSSNYLWEIFVSVVSSYSALNKYYFCYFSFSHTFMTNRNLKIMENYNFPHWIVRSHGMGSACTVISAVHTTLQKEGYTPKMRESKHSTFPSWKTALSG